LMFIFSNSISIQSGSTSFNRLLRRKNSQHYGFKYIGGLWHQLSGSNKDISKCIPDTWKNPEEEEETSASAIELFNKLEAPLNIVNDVLKIGVKEICKAKKLVKTKLIAFLKKKLL